MDGASLHHEIWKTVKDMNRAWALEGNIAALNDFFHPDMVAITPASPERLIGRDACIAGWKSFVDAATILAWREYDQRVRTFCEDRIAVVTYFYETRVEMGGTKSLLRGRDMMTLVKEGGKWLLIADQFSPFPGQSEQGE